MGYSLLHGLTVLGTSQTVIFLIVGALVGMVVGVVPGLSGGVLLSIILAFVYQMSLEGMLCLFLGTYAGSYFSASITSILLNTPAHPEAFAVTFDGFPMARRGEPGRALGISASATMVGGIVGCAILVGFISILNTMSTLLHPPEYVALIILAMLLVGRLGTDSIAKALVSMGIGLCIASIGPSVITGTLRYTFGSIGLNSGISLVAMACGLFAVPQMIMVFGTGTSSPRQDMSGRMIEMSKDVAVTKGFGRQVIGGVAESFRHWTLLIQSGVIGGLTGIVPGIGGFVANFMSYAIAKQTHRRGDLYGTGIPEGIIAPEGSSLSKEAGSMIPILSLGLPGSVGGALLVAALTIKGVKTGYGFTDAYPLVPYEIVWIIALTGLIATVAGVLIAPQLAKLTRVPGPIIVPFILALATLGSFVSDVAFFTSMEVLAFAVIGLVLRRLRYSLAAFVLGLVLGPTFETNVYLTRNIYGNFGYLSKRPLTDVFIGLILVVLLSQITGLRRRRNPSGAGSVSPVRQLASVSAVSDTAALGNEADGGEQGTASASTEAAAHKESGDYPLLAFIVTACLLGLSVAYTVYGLISYDTTSVIMPAVGGLFVAIPALYRLPYETRRYLRHRAEKARAASPDAAPSQDAAERWAPPDAGESSRLAIEAWCARVLTELRHPWAKYGDDRWPGIEAQTWGRHGEFTREFGALLWLAGLLAACYLVGFKWGIGVFMVLYGLLCTGRYFKSLGSRLIFVVPSALAMWAVTQELLSISNITFTPYLNLLWQMRPGFRQGCRHAI